MRTMAVVVVFGGEEVLDYSSSQYAGAKWRMVRTHVHELYSDSEPCRSLIYAVILS
jgi:hypothetical protein